ncbi:hypothetical protein DPEC_G00008090 [Dallia pectoralis]|uniref:Uncharacterized protein n=1 Tax=Dallia pectoralis TaxID=75939 RepID=A0ACC2HKK4_DALPE|nr:hypothetical protein DPEC_G00008090 [Dallia pectoralis]
MRCSLLGDHWVKRICPHTSQYLPAIPSPRPSRQPAASSHLHLSERDRMGATRRLGRR